MDKCIHNLKIDYQVISETFVPHQQSTRFEKSLQLDLSFNLYQFTSI